MLICSQQKNSLIVKDGALFFVLTSALSRSVWIRFVAFSLGWFVTQALHELLIQTFKNKNCSWE